MPDPLQFSVEFGKPQSDKTRRRGEPLRILFLTDLGETCQSRTQTSIASRPIREVDVDNVQEFLQSERPVLTTFAGDIAPKEIDDFDPDQLCKDLPTFKSLAELRRRLQDPKCFDAAAQDVRAMMNTQPTAHSDGPAADAEHDDDTLARILGKQSDKPSDVTDHPSKVGLVESLIQDAVAAHIVADTDPKADQYITAVDAAAAANLRAVLHDPAFQSLEAAWRGLHFLVSNIETSDELTLHVWNTAKSELIDAMGPASSAPHDSVLHRRIIEERTDKPFSLIVTDITFGPDPEDVRLLATLAAMAGRSGALVLAGVTSHIIGAQSWTAVANAPETVEEPDASWTALRDSRLGHQIVALAPGFMLRTPYGKRLEPVASFFDFEEIQQPDNEGAPFLWTTSSLLACVLISQSFAQDGWDASLNANLSFDDLPFVPYEADGEKRMKDCAEVRLPGRAAALLQQNGVTPVLAVQNTNEVRLPGFQSIASHSDNGHIGPFRV